MKIFAVSDLHSFFDETQVALNEAGFNPEDTNHLLVVCGDAFDRGPDSVKMLEWLLSLERLVYVKGNHDILMQDMLKRGYALWHDKHNGTEKTFYHLANEYANEVYAHTDACTKVKDALQPLYDKMVNYFETKKYVFCHGFLPTVEKENGVKINRQWRRASQKSWEAAMWPNGMGMVDYGLYLKNKTIVVGHWHASWGHSQFEGKPEWGEGADFSPFYYEDKLIAIDSCTAHTGKVNVLVLEDDEI